MGGVPISREIGRGGVPISEKNENFSKMSYLENFLRNLSIRGAESSAIDIVKPKT